MSRLRRHLFIIAREAAPERRADEVEERAAGDDDSDDGPVINYVYARSQRFESTAWVRTSGSSDVRALDSEARHWSGTERPVNLRGKDVVRRDVACELILFTDLEIRDSEASQCPEKV